MINVKKALSIVLSVLLVLSAMPFTVFAAGYVAKIGTTQYATLQDAVAAVPLDGTPTTITMIADYDFGDYGSSGIEISAEQVITLNLAGKKVTGTTTLASTSALILNYGTLTIKDSSGAKTGSLTCFATNPDMNAIPGYASDLIKNLGTVNIESGNFKNNTEARACYVIDNYGAGIVNISGGNLETAYATVVRSFQNTGSVSVSGNPVLTSPNAYGIQSSQSSTTVVNITGGTFNATYSLATSQSPNSSFAISGGELNGPVSCTTKEVIITGDAVINGNIDVAAKNFEISGGPTINGSFTSDCKFDQCSITGGVFTNPVPEEFLPAGESNYIEYNGGYIFKVCEIDGVPYASLQAAINAAPDDTKTTITLTTDIDLGEFKGVGINIPKGKNIVLDLGSFNISGTAVNHGTSSLINNEGTLEIKGSGTITYKSNEPDPSWGYGTNTICNQGTLTLTSGNIVNATVNGASYAVDNNSNVNSVKFTFDGGTITCPDGDQAVRQFCNSTKNTNDFVMNGGEITEGGFWLQMSSGAAKHLGTVEINDGTVNGKVDLCSNDPENTNVKINGGTLNISKLRIRDNDKTSDNTPFVNINGGTVTIEELDNQTEDQLGDSIVITNGTLKSETDEIKEAIKTCAAEGYEISENENGELVVEAKKVCESNGVQYATLAEAIAVAPTNGTLTKIKLLSDVTVTSNIGVQVLKGQNIELDLNGKTYIQNAPNAAASYIIDNSGTLTVTDDTTEQNGVLKLVPAQPHYAWSPAYASNVINNRGTLTVKAGSLINQEEPRKDDMPASGCYTVDCYAGSSLTVSGGTLKSGYIPVRTFCTTGNTISVNVTGGTLDGMYCFYLQQASAGNTTTEAVVNVTGGTFKSVDRDIFYVEATVSDITEIEVESGKFEYDENRKCFNIDGAAEVEVEVSGGTFSSEVPAEYCANGFAPVLNDNGEYTVEAAKVCESNGVQYPSIQDAINAALADTETEIDLISDVDLGDYGSTGIKVPAGKNIVLDLAGYKITGLTTTTSTSQMILNQGTLKIIDSSEEGTGAIASSATSAWQYNDDEDFSGSFASNTIRNEGTLIIEGGLIFNNLYGSAAYGIDNYYGASVSVTNAKVETKYAAGIRSFYSDSSIEINDGAEIVSGERFGIQAMGKDSKGNSAQVVINGGEITGAYSITTYDAATSEFEVNGGVLNGAVDVESKEVAIKGDAVVNGSLEIVADSIEVSGIINGEIKKLDSDNIDVTRGTFSDASMVIDEVLPANCELWEVNGMYKVYYTLYNYTLTEAPTIDGNDANVKNGSCTYTKFGYALDDLDKNLYTDNYEVHTDGSQAVSFSEWYLRTMVQVRIGTNTDLRLISMLDKNITNYSSAGFTLTVGNVSSDVGTEYVTKSFLDEYDGDRDGNETVDIMNYSSDEDYFFLQNTSISPVSEDTVIKVKPYLVLTDDTRIDGEELSFTYGDLCKEYNFN